MNEIIDTVNYTQAVTVHRRIMANAQAAQESLYEVCKGLKEMRDGKLYKELGYQNFEDYTENEVGIKRRQAYCYISIADKLSSDFVQSTAQIGVEKLKLLTTLSEEQRTEITENTDLENTSVRELEMQIKTLKNDKERLSEEAYATAQKLNDLNDEYDELKGENAKLVDKAYSEARKAESFSARNKELAERIDTLENEIRELENRPIEVAVQEDTKEIENLKSIIKQTDLEWSQKYTALEEEGIKRTGEEERRHKAELEKIIAEYEAKLSQASETKKEVVTETVTDDKEVFKAYLSMAISASEKLIGFLSQNSNPLYSQKTREYFERALRNI